MRIYCCGPSGTGKTTLCLWVQQELGIPFITTAGRSIWEKYNIRSHREVIEKTAKNPNWGYDYQSALLDEREKIMRTKSHFITDRSPVDNLVYFLMQVAPHLNYHRTLDFIERAKSLTPYIDKLIQLKWHPGVALEEDGARINNPIFQQCSQLYFDFCIDNYFPGFGLGEENGLIIHTDNFGVRKNTVSSWLNR